MATVPFRFECDKEAGFVQDPNAQRPFGYVLEMDGFGLSGRLLADLQVSVPFNSGEAPRFSAYVAPAAAQPLGTAKVIGVIETFEWNGGVGDPIKLDLYVSQENAMQIKALQQMALKTTAIKALAWWIADYDQESKKWYEAAYPLETRISGMITGKENPELNVDLSPVVVKEGIDVNVYKVSLQVVPAANKQYLLHFANSAQKKVVKSWGLVVGKLATSALPD
jgi:hypothetical protein